MAFGYGAGAYQQVRSHGGVESADAHGLITLLMDGALERLVRARAYMERGSVAEKGENISRVMDIISELRGSLDFKVESALVSQLAALYDYMGNRLLHANLRDDPLALDEVSRLLRQLRDAWVNVPAESRQPARSAP